MAGDAALKEELNQFRDEFLESRRDVNTYRKLKKYSKYGLYLSVFLIYITIALYASPEYTIRDPAFIGGTVVSVVSSILTILFIMNRREYEYNDYDLVYHEVAAFIDTIQHSSGEDDFEELIDRFERYVIDEEEGVVPKIWREELESYFEYIEEQDEERLSETFETVFVPLVETLDHLEGLELEEDYREDEKIQSQSTNQEPGFLSIVMDSLSSDVISKEMVMWTVFILAVGGGLVLAFVQGQGWGVLLVTIVFGGLRLYDQQRE